MTAFFCCHKTNIGRHLRQHFQMPPPIPMAVVLFLGIISWKGASLFNGGGGCFLDGGASFLDGGYTPWGALVLIGGFQKNR